MMYSKIVCPYPSCGKSFSSQSDYLKHSRVHSGERPYKCTFPGCPKTFTQSSHLYTHLKSHDASLKSTCDFPGCGAVFRSTKLLFSHMETHEGTKYECTFGGCKYYFFTKESLIEHAKTHSSPKVYTCSFPGCKAIFSSQGSLSLHEFGHTKQKKPDSSVEERKGINNVTSHSDLFIPVVSGFVPDDVYRKTHQDEKTKPTVIIYPRKTQEQILLEKQLHPITVTTSDISSKSQQPPSKVARRTNSRPKPRRSTRTKIVSDDLSESPEPKSNSLSTNQVSLTSPQPALTCAVPSSSPLSEEMKVEVPESPNKESIS